MTVKMTSLIMSAWLLASGSALGQSGLFEEKPKRGPHSDSEKMYEDIEIMRRLLTEKLRSRFAMHQRFGGQFGFSSGGAGIGFGSLSGGGRVGFAGVGSGLSGFGGLGGGRSGMGGLAGGGGKLAGALGGAPGGALGFGGGSISSGGDSLTLSGFAGVGAGAFQPSQSINLEGIYLPGQGVVFTGTLPAHFMDTKATGPVKPAPKPLSDWDRLRKEVRREKKSSSDRATQSARPSLSDFVLKILAENGKHLSQLTDQESLTVVFTFRGSRDPLAGAGAMMGGMGSFGGGRPFGLSNPNGGGGFSGGDSGAGSGSSGGGGKGTLASARDYELLGDLLLKQGKTDEALASFAKALELKPAAKKSAEIYRKMAQAFLNQSKLDQARAALEKALVFSKLSKQEGKDDTKPIVKPKPDDKKVSPSTLPAKLVISVPKKLLHQAGSGKLSFAAFRSAATVKYLTFSTGKK